MKYVLITMAVFLFVGCLPFKEIEVAKQICKNQNHHYVSMSNMGDPLYCADLNESSGIVTIYNANTNDPIVTGFLIEFYLQPIE